MQCPTKKLCIGDLLNKRIVAADGKHVGHVADVQLSSDQQYRVVALIFGRYGWLYRLHVLSVVVGREKSAAGPPRIPWEAVEQIDDKRVLLKPGYVVNKHSSQHSGTGSAREPEHE